MFNKFFENIDIKIVEDVKFYFLMKTELNDSFNRPEVGKAFHENVTRIFSEYSIFEIYKTLKEELGDDDFSSFAYRLGQFTEEGVELCLFGSGIVD